MDPEDAQKSCSEDNSVPLMPQEDRRLEDSALISLPPTRDDDPYMRIVLGAGLRSSPPPDAVPIGRAAFALDAPLVYPFIPAPTLDMEPLDDDEPDRTVAAAAAAAAVTEPPADHPAPLNDRIVAAGNTGPSTPTSTAVTAASLGTSPRASPDDGSTAGHWTAQDDGGGCACGDGSRGAKGEAEHSSDEDARCSLSYVRRVPSDGGGGAAAAYHLLHGQVWRGGSADRKRGWRRHQWVVDG